MCCSANFNSPSKINDCFIIKKFIIKALEWSVNWEYFFNKRLRNWTLIYTILFKCIPYPLFSLWITAFPWECHWPRYSHRGTVHLSPNSSHARDGTTYHAYLKPCQMEKRRSFRDCKSATDVTNWRGLWGCVEHWNRGRNFIGGKSVLWL